MQTNYFERYEIYDRVFDFMLRMGIDYLPTPLEDICLSLEIGLEPLSKIVDTSGMSTYDVFAIWHNNNGHLMPYLKKNGSYKFKIAYNDSIAHQSRKQFTIAEELVHYILGHYNHDMYKLFNPSPWAEQAYLLHEESARIGAGILLCPPPVFYELPTFLNSEDIKYMCNISNRCALTRVIILEKFKSEIINHPKYASLNLNSAKISVDKN